MEKRNKIIYWVFTGLLVFLASFSAVMYVANYEVMVETFGKLGYPAHIIYPLAVAKILGVIAIITKKSQTLKEWAYAGFFFDFMLAIMAHVSAGDGEFMGAVIATLLLVGSYVFDKKAFAVKVA